MWQWRIIMKATSMSNVEPFTRFALCAFRSSFFRFFCSSKSILVVLRAIASSCATNDAMHVCAYGFGTGIPIRCPSKAHTIICAPHSSCAHAVCQRCVVRRDVDAVENYDDWADRVNVSNLCLMRFLFMIDASRIMNINMYAVFAFLLSLLRAFICVVSYLMRYLAVVMLHCWT